MELTSTVTNWLWVGFFGMLVGTAMIYLLGSTLKATEKYHVYTAMAITTIAAIAYYAMANNQGIFMIGGKPLFLARYLDWLVTTPLLLISLFFLAYPADKDAVGIRQKLGVIASAVFADIVMIVTGAFANLSGGHDNKVFWYVVSCVAFLVVLGVMYGAVRKSAMSLGRGPAKLYSNLLTYLMVLFFIYPIVWLISTSGVGSINLGAEVAIYAVLDLCAKAVFGLLIVLSLKGEKAIDK